ncbi:hypothetical protein Scep_016537 [Stephania cephalantha]|uniref:Uncharacterized protein n=1 Tax=Stephania cephalantha TaxID=152367 RepID=A0AAP0IMU6_9MAGN
MRRMSPVRIRPLQVPLPQKPTSLRGRIIHSSGGNRMVLVGGDRRIILLGGNRRIILIILGGDQRIILLGGYMRIVLLGGSRILPQAIFFWRQPSSSSDKRTTLMNQPWGTQQYSSDGTGISTWASDPEW